MSRVRNLQTEQALRFLREVPHVVVEHADPCSVCAPEPCRGHEVVRLGPYRTSRITL